MPSNNERLLLKRHTIDWLGLRPYWMLSVEMNTAHIGEDKSELPQRATRFANELATMYQMKSI